MRERNILYNPTGEYVNDTFEIIETSFALLFAIDIHDLKPVYALKRLQADCILEADNGNA